MEDPVAVEVEEAIQELEEDGFYHGGGDGVAGGLSVVVDDLEEVVFAVFEDHEDAFFFEDDLDEVDEVRVGEFGAEGYFTNGGLGEARVLNCFAFFVGFEFLDGEDFT